MSIKLGCSGSSGRCPGGGPGGDIAQASFPESCVRNDGGGSDISDFSSNAGCHGFVLVSETERLESC